MLQAHGAGGPGGHHLPLCRKASWYGVPFIAFSGVCGQRGLPSPPGQLILHRPDRCDRWAGAGLRDPLSQCVLQNLKALEGKQNATLIPVLGLLCLLVSGLSGERQLQPFSGGGAGWAGSPPYVEGESIVERIRTTSARCVGEMCWVMWTMESMATSGLAWTKLRICLRT